MKLVVTHPYCWPYVRRGTERNIDGLGRYLHAEGVDVTTVSTSPGKRKVEQSDVGTRVLYSPRWHPVLGWIRIPPTHTFFWSAYRALQELPADIVHSFYITDAFAAQLLAKRRGFKTVLTINGTPNPGAFRRFLPPDRSLVRKVINDTQIMVTCSQFCADMIYGDYGVKSRVIVPPIDLEYFTPEPAEPKGNVVLLAVADFDQGNKGLRPLLAAFSLLKHEFPDAVLQLSGRMSEMTHREAMADLPASILQDIKVLGLGSPGDLPHLYRKATAMVLPSMWEASGTVMFESWACGTPVVATRHGGLTEFVRDDVGVLFEPGSDGQAVENVAGLADAMAAGIHLSRRPGMQALCRNYAQQYSWEAAGAKYQAVYAELLG